MERSRQVILGLGLTGALLVLGFGLLGDPRPGRVGELLVSRPGMSAPVASNPAAGEAAGNLAAPATAPHPGVEPQPPGETLPVTARQESRRPPGSRPRLPTWSNARTWKR